MVEDSGIEKIAKKALFFCCIFLWITPVLAQVTPPNRLYTFSSDNPILKKQLQDQVRSLSQPAGVVPSKDLDFQAPKVEYLREQNLVRGRGGVLISQGGVQVQADEGEVNMITKDAVVKGNLSMTSPDVILRAGEAALNIDSETGTFKDAHFTIEEGGFDVDTTQAKKLSEYEYELEESDFTACHCLDGKKPWEIRSSSCHLTQEGYAHTYNSGFFFQETPVFYAPWFSFPVKQQRASGVLSPIYGYNNRDGLRLDIPVFAVIDDSSDVIIDPFLAGRSRYGTGVEFRKTFSTASFIKSRMIYSDESARGSNPRGLNFSNIYHPEIDTHRFGGFYSQNWSPDPELNLPLQFIADGRYVSDKFFLRELPDSRIGDFNSQFLTSQAVARAQLWQALTAEVRFEGNQDLINNNQLSKQRLPEFNLSGSQSFKPFNNPFGMKLVTSGGAQVTDFVRTVGSDGIRTNLSPRVAIPFRVQNYFKAQVYSQLYQTNYNLRNQMDPTNAGQNAAPTFREVPATNSRTINTVGGTVSSSFEKVYEVDKTGWLSELSSLGAQSSSNQLVRIKHVVEPFTNYLNIPKVDQSDLPQFDYLDNIAQKSVVTYGVRNRILGRFTAPASRTRPIGELVPTLSGLPTLNVNQPLSDFSRTQDVSALGTIGNRDGSVREIANLALYQSYDSVAAKNTSPTAPSALSDLTESLTISPSNYLGASFGSNFNTQKQGFTQYTLGLAAQDDREDLIRLRYSYINASRYVPLAAGATAPPITQSLQSNLETKISERLKLGYYGSYDLTGHQFLENRGVLRFSSECKCWSIDVGYSEQLNPNLKQVLMTFTLTGLGDITQSFGMFQNPNQAIAPTVPATTTTTQ